MELKQLFYINNNKFVCQLVEKISKQKGINCYTLDQNEDFTYLVNDLRPEIIVVAQDVLNAYGDEIMAFIEKSELNPHLVLMSNNENTDQRFKSVIAEELNPLTFLQDLINLLGENNKNN